VAPAARQDGVVIEALNLPRWPGRSEAVARLVYPGSSVLDMGAGACGLRDWLPPGCTYTAIDAVPGGRPDIGECDLMQCHVDAYRFHQFDAAVMAGVLEHVSRPERAVMLGALWAKRLLFTYDPAADEHKPDGLTWRDYPYATTINGLYCARVGEWESHGIYEVNLLCVDVEGEAE
jgi:hypothetical protein